MNRTIGQEEVTTVLSVCTTIAPTPEARKGFENIVKGEWRSYNECIEWLLYGLTDGIRFGNWPSA